MSARLWTPGVPRVLTLKLTKQTELLENRVVLLGIGSGICFKDQPTQERPAALVQPKSPTTTDNKVLAEPHADPVFTG